MGLRGCFSFYAGYFPENILNCVFSMTWERTDRSELLYVHVGSDTLCTFLSLNWAISTKLCDYLSGIVHSYQQKPAVRNRHYRHCHSTCENANKYVYAKRSVVKGMEIKPDRSVNEVQAQMNAKNQWKHTSQATHTRATLIVFSMSLKCHDPWTRRWSSLKKKIRRDF